MTHAPIRLLVGLGNPGPEYADTRHNAGFWFAERLAAALGAGFSHESRFHARIAHARAEGLWLQLPHTYMNRSGLAVGALARFHRIPAAELLVVHDELDLPPGALRLKFGGGPGGHNGLKDITAHLGSQDYWRLRIGIGHPGDRHQVAHYVLKPPRAEEQAEIDAAIQRALDLWPLIAAADWQAAMQRAHTRPAPAPPKPPAASTP